MNLSHVTLANIPTYQVLQKDFITSYISVNCLTSEYVTEYLENNDDITMPVADRIAQWNMRNVVHVMNIYYDRVRS